MRPIECCGDDLLSVVAGNMIEVQQLAMQLRNSGDWLEVVPGIDSVVVQFDAAAISVADAQERLSQAMLATGDTPKLPDSLVEIPVSYGGGDGPDLDDVCARLDISPEQFIAMHTKGEYRVELVGFTPGFVYIGGLDERLRLPRRSEPRARVPAGSVAIADDNTGIYSLPSPGGWWLVGRTSMPLFDPASPDPVALRAGMRVRFVAS